MIRSSRCDQTPPTAIAAATAARSATLSHPASPANAEPIRISRILGDRRDPALHDRLHDLGHHGEVDALHLPAADLPRHRLQARTAAGRALHIALPREQALMDGAVLHLDARLAIVLHVQQPRALRLTPGSIADALALGWHAGNLHWPVRFEEGALVVPLDGSPDDYLARLGELAAPGRLGSQIIDTAG